MADSAAHGRAAQASRATGGAASGGQIKELKVSGHTMTLDPGLYCVFNAPGAPAPTAGLPGVRITVGPARPDHVAIATFNPDGWVGADEGALVRVAGGTAEVLVTVYQAKDSKADAPKLQVVRLSAEPGAELPALQAQPASKPAATTRAVDAPEGVEVMAHIYARGDVGGPIGAWMGEAGSQRWIEGFGIAPTGTIPLEDIEYQAVLGRGWLSPWSQGGEFCGSRGMSLPILGLRVRLRGPSAETHRVELSASFVDGTQIGPVADGEPCEAPSLAALEAFLVAFAPREATRPARRKPAPAPLAAAPKTAAPKTAAPKAAAPKAPAPKAAAPKAAAKGKAKPTPATPEPAPRRAPATPRRR